MAVIPIQSFKVDSPADAQTRKRTFGENFSVGFKSGLKETTIGMLANISAKQKAINEGTEFIAEEDWNESNPFYVPGVAYESYMTYEYAARMKDNYDFNLYSQDIASKSSTFGKAGQFVGMFGGAVFDPVNLLPLGTAKIGLGFLRNAARVGAGNAAIELGLTPLYQAGYKARGEEYGADDVLMNVGMAFGAGVGLYGAGSGISKLIKRMRGTNPGDYNGKNNVLETLNKFEEQNPNLKITDDIRSLIETGAIKLSRGTADITDINNIGSKKIADVPEVIFVDTAGNTFNKTFDGAIKISSDASGNVVVTGARKDILKISRTLDNSIADDRNILLKFDDGEEFTVNRKQFTKFIENEEKVFKTPSKLDEDYRVVKSDGEQEFEFEITPEGLGRAFVIKNGKRTALDQKARDKLVATLKDDGAERKKIKTELLNEDRTPAETRTLRTGNETIETQAQNTLRAHKTLNDIDAVSSARGSEFNANASNPITFLKAVLAGRAISSTRLKRLGFDLDKDNLVLRQTTQKTNKPIRPASNLTDGEKEMRTLLLKSIDEMENGRVEPTAKEELFACIPKI